jgi:hypothetical protein
MKQLLILLLLCFAIKIMQAQDSLRKDNTIYYGTFLGYGIGSGFPLPNNDVGLSFAFEIMAQKAKSTFILGYRVVTEFDFLNQSNVSNAIYSFDGMYGRVLKKRAFNGSINVGIGYVTSQEKGKLISSDGLLFGSREYKKISSSTIGFPISVKAFWVPKKWIAIGGDAYLNINSICSFWGIQIGAVLGKLPSKKAWQK